MSAYAIKRWDAVMFGNSLRKVPMIYVEPDETFLEFARANQFSVLCEIHGTGTNYDYKPHAPVKLEGIVDTSSVVPSCRPNYFAKTGYYVVTLLAPWIGYPPGDRLGQVKFFGLKEGIRTQIPAPSPKVKHKLPKKSSMTKGSSPTDNNRSKKDNTLLVPSIILIVCLVAALGIVIYAAVKK